MKQDFWGAETGEYLGYREEENFYSPSGEHVGKIKQDVVHSTKTGCPVGKIKNSKYLTAHTQGSNIGISTTGNRGTRSCGDIGGCGGADPHFP